MPIPKFSRLDNGIFCIDTGLYRHGLAACYLIREADRLAFVDTGTAHTVPGLMELVGSLGLGPEAVDYIIPTHVHLDHGGGAGDLMALCPNARLVIHPKGAPHMIDPAKLTAGATAVYGEEAFARDFGHLTPVPEERMIVTEDGLELDFAGRTLTCIDTPGHANHHHCIFDTRSRGFFTGDTFGISYREFDGPNGPFIFAPTTPVAFDPDAWLESLNKLMAFDPQVMYLTHFGRLEHPGKQVDNLRTSVQGMAELAIAEERRGSDRRQARLRDAMTAFLTQNAQQHVPGMKTERIRNLLRVDIDLNAQGLEVWLQRRAKATRTKGS